MPRIDDKTFGRFLNFAWLFLAAIVLLPLSGFAGGDEARFYVETDAAQYEIGDTLTAELKLDVNAQAPSRLGVFLEFDPSRLQFNTGTTNRTVFDNIIFTGDPMVMESGIVSFSASSVDALSQNEVLVATLEFTVLSSGNTSLNYLATPPRETTVADSEGTDLPLILEGATVDVLPLPKARVHLAPSLEQIAVSGTVDVDVLLDAPEIGVRQTEVFISYDSSILEFVSADVNDAEFDSTLITKDVEEPTTGILAFATGSFIPATGDDLRLATIQFRGLVEGQSELNFLGTAPQRTQAKDMDYSNILTQTTGAMIDVGDDAFARLSLSPEAQTGPVGEPVVVEVFLDAVQANAGVVEVFLDYDETRLDFIDGSLNTAVFNNGPLNQTPVSNGNRISFTAATGSGVGGVGIPVATLNFRSTNPGQADFSFLTSAGQVTSVVTPELSNISTTLDSGWARAVRVGVAGLRFEPKLGGAPFNASHSLEVWLDANGEAVRSVRAFVSFDELLTFTSGTLNSAVFDNAALNDEPQLSISESGVVTLSANALGDVIENDVLVATLAFDTGAVPGVAAFEFLTRNANETGLFTSSFSSIPVNVDSGTLFVREDTLMVANITRAVDSPTSDSVIAWTVAFTDVVSGVDLTDFELDLSGGIGDAALLSVSGNGNIWTVEASVGEGAGQVGLNLRDDDSIIDGSLRVLGGPGVGNGDFLGPEYSIDTIQPGTLLLTFVSSPTNAPLIPIEVSFTEFVFGFTETDIAISSGMIEAFSGTGDLYSFMLNAPEGDVEVSVPAGVTFDVVGNANLASSNTLMFAIDRTAPTISVAQSESSPTNNQTLGFDVQFSEDIGNTFTETDVSTTGTLSGSASFVLTGSGTDWHVAVDLVTGNLNGTLGIVIGTQVFDAASNGLTDSTSSFYTIDTTPAEGTFARLDSEVTSQEEVRFSLSLTEPLLGFTIDDLEIVSQSITSASVVSMTGSGTSFEITVNTGSEEGELGLEFLGGDAVTDFAGNGVNSTTEFYTVDRRQPIPNLETAGGSPTNSNSIAFTVDFNEPVFGFDQGDVSISSGSVSNFAGSTDSYSFDVEGATDGDALLVQVPAGGAMDAGGNLNEASQQISLAIDRTNPTLLITLDGTSPTNSDAIIFDLEFSESVVGLSNDDLSTSGSLSSAVKFGITGSDANYQITATLGDGTVDGTISLIVSGDVSDPAGNGLDPTESALVEVDNTAPIAVLADRVDPSPTNLTTVLFNVQFSEPVSGFSDEDTELIAPDLSGTTVSDVTPFGESGFIVSVFTGTGTGPLQLRVLDDDSVADAAGNVLGGAGAGNGELDGETYFINEGDLGPTGLTTQQIIDFLNGENPYGFDSSLFDVNQDGVIDAADAVANGL